MDIKKKGILSYTCELSGLYHFLVIPEKIKKLAPRLTFSSTSYYLNLSNGFKLFEP